MRLLALGFTLLLWFVRTADPMLHALVHDHREHCFEKGQHLHEGEDSCQWSDPAFLVGVAPSAIYWQFVPRIEQSTKSIGRTSAAAYFQGEAVCLRGPPIG